MVAVAIVVLGLAAWRLLPIGLMPAIDIPQVTVRIHAPSLSARELQASVVGPLRAQLMQTGNLAELKAEAKDGGALIFMQFNYGADIDYLFIEVNERIDRAMGSLPKSVARPSVVKAGATDLPAFYLNVNYKQQGDFLELSSFSRSVIARRLEQLPAVAFVDLSGWQSGELTVEFDQSKIEAMGLSVDQIAGALRAKNINLGNLVVRDGQYQYTVRFQNALSSQQDVESTPVAVDGRIYPLGELATVSLGAAPSEGVVVGDGKQAITMAVIKQADARMDALRVSINELTTLFEKEYPDLEFTITRDQTSLLDYSLDSMKQNLLVGALLACLILFLFMQDLRTPLLVTITIPLSLIVSLLFFFSVGISINVVSLSGLLLGLGMMVDNSIIVIDNISQRWDRGEGLFDAVSKGASEVFAPMLSSVLTTCSIFVPLVFLSGIAGAMFYDQAMAVSIGLVSSLIVAMTIIPVYYYLLYRGKTVRVPNRFLQRFSGHGMQRFYERGLKWTFRHAVLAWVLMGAMLAGSVGLYFVLDKEALPAVAVDDLLVEVDWNAPVSVDENKRRTAALVASLGDQVSHYTAMIGRGQFVLSHTPELSGSQSLIYIRTSGAVDSIANRAVRYVQHHYPQATVDQHAAGNLFDMIFSDPEAMLTARLRPTDGRPADPDQLSRTLGAIQVALPGVWLAPIEWQEHQTIRVRDELLALYRVDAAALQTVLRAAFNENMLFEIRQGQFSLPLKIGDRPMTLDEAIANKTVRSADGVDVPIRQLVDQSTDRDLRTLASGTEGDYYPVPLDVADFEVPATVEAVREAVGSDSGFEVGFSGSYFGSRAMVDELAMVLVVSLLLLYFILAAQFESMIQPLIILSEIAVDLFGALLLLWLCGSSLNLMSMIGIVVMCGIVINDSILKVDTINRLRRGGMSSLRAIWVGGHRRLKPIIMTSLTTILAIVPFLFSGGMGNDLQRPLSLALIGGMVVGTIVSVFFIPLLYHEIYRKRTRK